MNWSRAYVCGALATVMALMRFINGPLFEIILADILLILVISVYAGFNDEEKPK